MTGKVEFWLVHVRVCGCHLVTLRAKIHNSFPNLRMMPLPAAICHQIITNLSPSYSMKENLITSFKTLCHEIIAPPLLLRQIIWDLRIKNWACLNGDQSKQRRAYVGISLDVGRNALEHLKIWICVNYFQVFKKKTPILTKAHKWTERKWH